MDSASHHSRRPTTAKAGKPPPCSRASVATTMELIYSNANKPYYYHLSERPVSPWGKPPLPKRAFDNCIREAPRLRATRPASVVETDSPLQHGGYPKQKVFRDFYFTPEHPEHRRGSRRRQGSHLGLIRRVPFGERLRETLIECDLNWSLQSTAHTSHYELNPWLDKV